MKINALIMLISRGFYSAVEVSNKLNSKLKATTENTTRTNAFHVLPQLQEIL